MVRVIPSFRGRRHSDATRFKISCARRGKSYEQIFGPHVGSYLKQVRRQHAVLQPRNPNFSFGGWQHSPESKQKMRAAKLKTRTTPCSRQADKVLP